jgi:hypothetical protein
MNRIEKRLDTEAVASRKQSAVILVPQHERKLTAQFVQTVNAEVFVEMQCDFAVGPCAQMVTSTFELALSGLVVVELAVDDNVLAPILTGNGLVSGRKVDNAESRVPRATSLSDEIQCRCPSGPRWYSRRVALWSTARVTGLVRENIATIPHIVNPSIRSSR